MSEECQRYHCRFAELLAVKKQESYASTIVWIRTKISFAVLRSAMVWLRLIKKKSYSEYTRDWLRIIIIIIIIIIVTKWYKTGTDQYYY